MATQGFRVLVCCCLATALTLASAGAVARNFGMGSGYTDPKNAPLFSDVRAKLIHDGRLPAKLQHDYRDLCTNDDWSHVCKRFPEVLDCQGASRDGDCDFIFEGPKGRGETHGSYVLVSTMMTARGRVVDHEQPPDIDDDRKILARQDLKRRGCGEERLLEIRVCDPSWKPPSRITRVFPPALSADGLRWIDPEHAPRYSTVRAKLIRDGYRPAKLQHDVQDFCTGEAWSHFCRRFRETLDCMQMGHYDGCDMVFERPAWETAAHGPYLVVETAKTRRSTVAYNEEPPDTQDLKKIWAREDLQRRGCEEEYLLETRDCNWPPYPSPSKASPSEKPLPVPVLPPLPPSLR